MCKVEILRHPTDGDWERCKMLALNTVGKEHGGGVTDEWKRRMLLAGHSPIRTLMFTIRMADIPYYVSTHLVRHKFGVEHYVSTQRNDRQDRYDRRKAPQDAPVTHVMDVNAQELMQMAHMRLCGSAAEETRDVMQAVCDAVLETNPEFEDFLLPKCIAMNGLGNCNEFKPCKYVHRYIP